MGHAGMGGREMQRLREISMKGPTATVAERAEQLKIRETVADRLAKLMGRKGTAGWSTQQLVAKMGFMDFVQQFQTATSEGRKLQEGQLEKITSAEQSWNKQAELQVKAISLMEKANALSETSAGFLGILASGEAMRTLGVDAAEAIGGVMGVVGGAFNVDAFKEGGKWLEKLFDKDKVGTLSSAAAAGMTAQQAAERERLRDKANAGGIRPSAFDKQAGVAAGAGLSAKEVNEYMAGRVKIRDLENQKAGFAAVIENMQKKLEEAQKAKDDASAKAYQGIIDSQTKNAEKLNAQIETLNKSQEKYQKKIAEHTGVSAEENKKTNANNDRACSGYRIEIAKASSVPTPTAG